MTIRISKRKLAELNTILSERDKAILHSIKLCRFLKTDQIRRLHFTNTASTAAALRATTRTLVRLKNTGLTQTLQRRIGGVRAGSTSYVWALRAAGVELLNIGRSEAKDCGYSRVFEPTYIFIKHILAVAELYTRLCSTYKILRVEFEPLCWRGYVTALGITVTLKPDLYAVVVSDGYEDHWFFEVDLDTEAPSRVIRKCESYGRYYLTGNEQKRVGVFPRVVWIVPSIKRRDTILRYIGEHLSEYTDLFAVNTFDGLDELLRTMNGN